MAKKHGVFLDNGNGDYSQIGTWFKEYKQAEELQIKFKHCKTQIFTKTETK